MNPPQSTDEPITKHRLTHHKAPINPPQSSDEPTTATYRKSPQNCSGATRLTIAITKCEVVRGSGARTITGSACRRHTSRTAERGQPTHGPTRLNQHWYSITTRLNHHKAQSPHSSTSARLNHRTAQPTHGSTTTRLNHRTAQPPLVLSGGPTGPHTAAIRAVLSSSIE
jgi:hypothetical protein